jgi:hypothetical protein
VGGGGGEGGRGDARLVLFLSSYIGKGGRTGLDTARRQRDSQERGRAAGRRGARSLSHECRALLGGGTQWGGVGFFIIFRGVGGGGAPYLRLTKKKTCVQVFYEVFLYRCLGWRGEERVRSLGSSREEVNRKALKGEEGVLSFCL